MDGAGSKTPPLSCLGNRYRFLGSAMGIAIANRKYRCDFGALRASYIEFEHLICNQTFKMTLCNATILNHLSMQGTLHECVTSQSSVHMLVLSSKAPTGPPDPESQKAFKSERNKISKLQNFQESS